jgi:glycine/D-amino acid oxidase-like deaminating enzyme
MDLHTGVPLWRDLAPSPTLYGTATGDIHCDVAVLGGGVTGALVACYLICEGVETVLLDKAQPGGGSTAASTGLLQYEIDTHLSDLIEKRGAEPAVHAYRRGLWAIDEIERITGQLGDRCGFTRCQSLYFASEPAHGPSLQREYDCRRQYGFAVRHLSSRELTEISTIAAPGAILSEGDAQIDPYAFTTRLVAFTARQGLRVFGDTRVLSVHETEHQVILQTATSRITARAAVFATGYEAHQQLKSPRGKLQSTYALASAPRDGVPGWPNRCLIWETARPYFYGRQTDDGRVLIGGADTPFADDHQRDELIGRKAHELTSQFAELFPDARFEPAYAWAGTFAETADGLAYIGKPQDRARTYFALGYGGNGITFSAIAGRLIADLYVRRPNADAAVFSFDRSR